MSLRSNPHRIIGCSYAMKEETIRLTADAFIELGLNKVGYTYVNLDDCWAQGRDPVTNVIYPDPVKFPSGMAALADYMHSKNLKFGVYTDRGNYTCAGRPAAGGFEKLDATTFAKWGVDFLKEDSCNASQDHNTAFYEYGLMRDAMNATGRPIYFDACGWNDWYAPVGATLANEWRIGPDDGNWGQIINNINIDASLAQYAGPGGWNNPCLLIASDAFGNQIITEVQSRFQFSMWAILSAPLMLSLNVRMLSDYLIDTYTNTEVIAVNQDPLGKQGVRLWGTDLDPSSNSPQSSTNVWGRQLYNKSWVVAFVNVGTVGATVACDQYCFAQMGFKVPGTTFAVRDLWEQADLADFNGSIYLAHSVQAAGGVVLLKFTPK